MREPSPYFIQRTSPPAGEGTAVLNGPVVEENEGIDLWGYWWVLRKHLWLIATFFFGTVLVKAFVVFTTTPIYTAETTLLIERQAPQVLDIRQVLSEDMAWDEYDYYKTQYEILKSRDLAARVIQEQDLEKNSLFTGEKREEGLVAGLWAKAEAWVKEWVGAERVFSPPSESPAEDSLEVNPQMIGTYIGMLETKPVRGTRLVKIVFSTPNPKLSALLANAHAQAYIHQGLALHTLANEEGVRFLEEKLVGLKERVEKSEAALNSYRRDKSIISLDDKENLVVDRLTDLNKRLTEAEAEKIGLEAQVHLIRKREYDSLPAVVNSGLIHTLKEQLAHLEGDYAQLSSRFQSGYPRLAQLQAQVEEARSRLQQETQRVVEGTESAYLAAEAIEKELRAKVEEQKAVTLGLKDASVEYTILAREVDTNRQLYDSVLQRMKEMGVAAQLRASNVSVIDKANPPRVPSQPNKKRSLLLGALMGLTGGVGVAFFLEYLDKTLKTPEEVERYLRLPNLSTVPDFSKLNGRSYGYTPKRVLSNVEGSVRQVPEKRKLGVRDRGLDSNSSFRTPGTELVLAYHPLSVVSEAYRTLRTAIMLSRAGEPPKTILFTSGVKGEGKTSTTVNTAIVFAQMGVKVLVIDADLRRSRCHEVLGMENGLGLTELLTGQREPQEVIKPTVTDNLFLLGSGSTPPNPTELLGSKKMQETLAFLQEHYDYILIDSPPVMLASDTVLLSTMVDGVILVVSGQETPKQVVRETRSRLNYAHAKILGVVLNRVNVQSGAYVYYYRHYYSYYHPTGAKGTGLTNED